MTLNAYDRAHFWLFEQAFPFWSAHGMDRAHGGYVEQLRLDATNADVDFKRVRVIARQVYSFSHAAILGFANAAEPARQGFEYLTKFAWLGPHKGWARQLWRDGQVKDPTSDLYDLAFVLFACGWYQRLSGEAIAGQWALRTLDFIESHMRFEGDVGFKHEQPAQAPRLQNPHMHLLEAALVNFEVSGNQRFLKLADEIVGLFASRFFDPATRTLGEYYDDHWRRAAGELGRSIEPGHHFEWAWILAAYQRLSGNVVARDIEQLVAFAEAHGVDRSTGNVFNTVRDDGAIIDGNCRVWPNTERLQAAVAMFEIFDVDPRPIFDQSTRFIFERFLTPAPAGTWIDRTERDGQPSINQIPTSTLYHLVIAFSEMLRVRGEVERKFGPMPESKVPSKAATHLF